MIKNCYQSMLDALHAFAPQAELDAREKVVLDELRARGILQADDGYLEYMCAEHNVVHVHSERIGWVAIDPVTTEVTVIGH